MQRAIRRMVMGRDVWVRVRVGRAADVDGVFDVFVVPDVEGGDFGRDAGGGVEVPVVSGEAAEGAGEGVQVGLVPEAADAGEVEEVVAVEADEDAVAGVGEGVDADDAGAVVEGAETGGGWGGGAGEGVDGEEF
ncbi:hypothetical protein EG329_002939 [Mollisiaceae sp. DMI_Dod_QoI]|nr:hypothetical protein EG329_002939 [Helotiales sp. DMI_Dod_QoI]